MLLGIDIIETERVAQALSRSGERLVHRLLTVQEQRYVGEPADNVQRFAGIWAAKEAAVKALGTGFRFGISFHDIEIFHNELGQPYFQFSGEFLKLMNQKSLRVSTLSISHCATHAISAAALG